MKKDRIPAFMLTAIIAFCSASCGNDKDSSSSSAPDQPDGNVTDSENIELHAAFIYDNVPYVTDMMESYSRQSNGVTVNITYFSAPEGDCYGTEALNSLTRDILSGEAPDLIVGFPQNLENLQRNGYLANLYPLMETNDVLTPDSLLPNVREALEVDGTLPYIIDSFYYRTYICGADVWGSECENWSLDEAMAAYESYPDKSDFLLGYHRQSDLWDFFLACITPESIDFEHSSCDFSGDFKRTLEFLAALPDTSSEFEVDSEMTEYRGSETPLVQAFAPGLNSAAAQVTYGHFFGEEVIYTGSPSAMTNGAEVFVNYMYGIPEMSAHKKEAWQLLSKMFTLSQQKNMSLQYGAGFPVTEEAFNALAYDTPDYDGQSVRSVMNSYLGEEYEIVISDEALEKLISYTRDIDINIHYSDELRSMIRFEWLKVYHGEESVDECVKALDNKVGLYLSEKE